MPVSGKWLVGVSFTVLPRDSTFNFTVSGVRSGGITTCSFSTSILTANATTSATGYKPPYSLATSSTFCTPIAYRLRVIDSEGTFCTGELGANWRSWSLAINSSTPVPASGQSSEAVYTIDGLDTDLIEVVRDGNNWFVRRNGANARLIGVNNQFTSFTIGARVFIPTVAAEYQPSGYIRLPTGGCFPIFPWMNLPFEFANLSACQLYQPPQSSNSCPEGVCCPADSECIPKSELQFIENILDAIKLLVGL